jgi:glycerol-3-phosphate responsive antiterminator
LLTAGKLLSFHFPGFPIKAKALQNRLCFSRVFKAAFAFILVLQIAVLLEDLFQIVAGVGHTMFEVMHLVFDLLQPAKRAERRFVDGRTGFEVNVLRKQSELQATRAHNVSTVGRLFLSDQLEDGGFARAVAAYQTDVLTRIDLERSAPQNILRAE